MSEEVCIAACLHHKILLLGKMGYGKSTLGNRILNHDGSFTVNYRKFPQTRMGISVLKSVSQCQDYVVEVYDHDGLFEGASSIDTLSSEIPEDLNMVLLVLKRELIFNEEELKILSTIVHEWKIGQVSALVLTHCEHLSEEEREEMVEQFKKDHPSVAELMGKGILAVGFPDSSHVPPGSELSQMVEEDKKRLRYLIYSCDRKVTIPRVKVPLNCVGVKWGYDT